MKYVPHPKTGELMTPVLNKQGKQVTDSNGELWFRVLVESEPTATVINGVAKFRSRKCFVTGTKKDLEQLEKVLHEFMIQRKLSREPFYDNQSPVVNPSTGEVVKIKGGIAYQVYELVPVSNLKEVWVTQDNVPEEEDSDRF